MDKIKIIRSADENKTALLIIPADALGFTLELIQQDCPNAKISIAKPNNNMGL